MYAAPGQVTDIALQEGEQLVGPGPVAAGDTVRKLVDGFINPIVQFIVGSQDALNSAVWRLEVGNRSADIAWGPFVSSLITLVATALVIYLIVNLFKLDRIDKKKS